MLGVEEGNGGCSVPLAKSRDCGLIVPAPGRRLVLSDGNRAQDEDAPTRLSPA